MYRVEVKNSCKCFLRSGLCEHQSFETRDEAKEEAERLLEHMQTKFCNKHEFSLSESFGHYTIYIRPRQ